MSRIKDIPPSVYDIIIIGGGPSGLTAAIYTSRARLKTLVFESPYIASQASWAAWIENYPGFAEGISGLKLTENLKNQAKGFGAEFVAAEVKEATAHRKEKTDIWQIMAEDKTYDSLSLIVASGARPKKLEIAGEDKFLGRGVSYCATCDGPLFKDNDVVVVGGGDTAAEEALFLTRFARKVMLIHRRDRLRAAKILQERILSDKKIEVLWNSVVDEISGSKAVETVKVKDLTTNKIKDIPCGGVFISAGLMPNTHFVKNTVDLDKNGYIIVDNRMRTSKEGVFACGDCRDTSFRQIVTACGDGALAAFSCQQYVEELKGTAYK